MKTLLFDREKFQNGSWIQDGKKEFTRISRWITFKTNYNPSITRNELADYIQDGNGYHSYDEKFDPSNGLYLDYFTYKGRNYAREAFWALNNPFYMPFGYKHIDKNGDVIRLSAVWMDGSIFGPSLYMEISADGEKCRLYEG